jgi:hypothetical protein
MTKATNHVYVFVRIGKRQDKEEEISYYPVRSTFVAKKCRFPNPEKPEDQQYRKGFTMDLKDVERSKGKWSIFGVS